MKTQPHIQIAALTARLRKPGNEIQLFPAGLFRARDGRPEGLEGWQVTEAAAKQLVALAAQRQTPFVIDYEHQTLYAETSGNPAPAAAWFTTLEWREGDGLYAVDVQWTERAAALIEGDEYRYLSPVFKFDRNTGLVTELLMAAVTNNPAIDGIADVAAARYLHQPHEEATPVDKELLEMLGLGEDATPEQVRAAIQALKEKADKAEQAEADAAALRAKVDNPDPARFGPVSTIKGLQDQVATLSAKLTSGEVEGLVKDGMEDGRLLPSMESWARDLGKKDVEALRSYLDNAQPIAALTGQQTDGKKPPEGDNQLTEEELAVCRQMNQTPEEFLKAKGVKVEENNA
ncbi:MAG: phage protease [Alteromonadaceae bacterium]|nr:phage protease [Alteromonadaceae bacterium]